MIQFRVCSDKHKRPAFHWSEAQPRVLCQLSAQGATNLPGTEQAVTDKSCAWTRCGAHQTTTSYGFLNSGSIVWLHLSLGSDVVITPFRIHRYRTYWHASTLYRSSPSLNPTGDDEASIDAYSFSSSTESSSPTQHGHVYPNLIDRPTKTVPSSSQDDTIAPESYNIIMPQDHAPEVPSLGLDQRCTATQLDLLNVHSVKEV